MLTNDNIDKILKDNYESICESLNIHGTNVAETSWNDYQSLKNDHNLEGEQIHWLCCALYVAYTYNPDDFPGISLTKLLRLCNIKLYEFSKKTEQWIRMANPTKEFRDRFDRLRRSLAVSILVFEKYKLIFEEVFNRVSPTEELMAAATLSSPQKNRRSRAGQPTLNKVYEFGWYLFISTKSEYPENTIDLVTSFHTLLCCIDLVYANVVHDKRQDLLNPNFEPGTTKTPPSKNDRKSDVDTEPISIINVLCNNHDASKIDALDIKSHNFRNLMNKYFGDGVLKGNANTFTNLLTPQNFEINLSALKKRYDKYVMSVGEIDEGIFLVQAELDTPNDGIHSQMIRTLMPETPLTRRHCLPGKDGLLASPVSIATENVKRLNTHLGSGTPGPSLRLRELCKSCNIDPLPKIAGYLQAMSVQFCTAFQTNAAVERFQLAERLYYRLLENIIQKEKAERPSYDAKILNVEKLHMMLIASSVEIVIYAYATSHKFPWILECFELDAFYFYKLIEIIVLNHEGILNRDLIKHLNAIEEQCLESLAWKSTSPLWTTIKVWLKEQKPLPRENNTRTGSVNIFFRKFYSLASLRLQKLARDLDLSSYLQAIWTTFEYSILNHVHLMEDRHLDQLLMCSIYIFARAQNMTTKFKDIMTVYRSQPQAESHIYREVLGTDNTRFSIIDFYNTIYVKQMQEFVLKLKGSSADDVSLSPLPAPLRCQQSPRKISKNHHIYVQELQTNEILQSPESISYKFNSSPMKDKDLLKINKLVSEELNTNGKRSLANTEHVPYTNKKLQSLMTDREENSDK